MKSRIIITVLICVFVIGVFIGCGKSESVKNVEMLINEIGEVTLDSKEKINKAETAFNALNDKEKSQVENSDDIKEKKKEFQACVKKAKEEEAAKAAEEKKAALEEKRKKISKFEGKWVSLYQEIMSHDYFHQLDLGNTEPEFLTIDAANEFVTPIDENTIHLYSDIHMIEDNGITKLVRESDNEVFVRESEYDEITEKMFKHVKLDEQNIGDYYGEIITVGQFINEWGDVTDSDVYSFKNKAYENEGLVLLASEDVKFEFFLTGQDNSETSHGAIPFMFGWGSPVLDHFGRAEGNIWYVKKEYVSEIRELKEEEKEAMEQSEDFMVSDLRNIVFTDGYSTYSYVGHISEVSITNTNFIF